MSDASVLDAEAIFDRAAADYGLEAYADPAIRERFVALVALFNAAGPIPRDQLPPAVADMRQAVVNRLSIARDWAEHPQILEERIERPIFVTGNARAGTTLAQALFGLGDGCRTPRYHEALFPSPPRGLNPRADALARQAADAYVAAMLNRDPRLLVSHPYHDQGALAEAEDEFVYGLDFRTLYPLFFLNTPTLPTSPRTMDRLEAMRFLKAMLGHMQWKTPTRRWVGKGVFHQYVLKDLFAVFPDAVVVWTHRPPEDYIASLAGVTEFIYRPVNGPRYTLTGPQLAAGIQAAFTEMLKDPMIDDPRVTHVRFADMVADPVATIAATYAAHDLEFTPAYEARLRQRLADPAHRADRHGRYVYANADYGLDRDDLKQRFAPYRERFGL